MDVPLISLAQAPNAAWQWVWKFWGAEPRLWVACSRML